MIKILNVACGSDTYGTHFIDLYKKNKGVIKCDLNKEKIPFEDNYFDEVCCNSFLQHSTNVGNLINEMKRVLKKGGKLIIRTDNANYWLFALKKSAHRINRQDYKAYSLFTDEHLKSFFDYYGLKIKEIKYSILKDNSKNKIKKTIKNTINFILLLTPLNKFAYKNIYIEGIK